MLRKLPRYQTLSNVAARLTAHGKIGKASGQVSTGYHIVEYRNDVCYGVEGFSEHLQYSGRLLKAWRLTVLRPTLLSRLDDRSRDAPGTLGRLAAGFQCAI